MSISMIKRLVFTSEIRAVLSWKQLTCFSTYNYIHHRSILNCLIHELPVVLSCQLILLRAHPQQNQKKLFRGYEIKIVLDYNRNIVAKNVIVTKANVVERFNEEKYLFH